MSSPSIRIWPPSGRSRPKASLRIVLLPEPATPNRALVSPRESENEIPSSTALSLKARKTLSNATTSRPDSAGTSEGLAMERVGIGLVRPQNQVKQASQKEIDDENQHRGDDYCLGSSLANALRSTLCRHSVVAAHGGNQEAIKDRLHQTGENVVILQNLPGSRPVLAPIQAKQCRGHHAAAKK